jgi:hypothetical protein
MTRAWVFLFLFLLLAACGGTSAGDTDTDTDTDPDPDTSFGPSDDAPDTFTTRDDNDVFGDSTTTGDDPDTSSSTAAATDGDTDTDTDTDASTTAAESSTTEVDPTHGDPGDCCDAHPTETGCENEGVQACVCDMDPQCCDLTWDDACVVEVVIFGCAECPGIGGDGDCCMPNGSPGCDDDEVEACVCAMDIACCNDTWDQICVDEVTDFRCGSCP